MQTLENIDCLVFNLKNSAYALKVSQVEEILSVPALTKLPTSPSYLKGVFMLRKDLVTVLDVSEALGDTPSDTTLAIVVKIGGSLYGLEIESVSEVNKLSFEGIPTISNPFVEGICKKEGQLIQYLNVEKMIKTLSTKARKVA